MKKKSMSDSKNILEKVRMLNNYVNITRVFFYDLEKYLSNPDLNDREKVIVVRNCYNELKKDLLS